MTDSSSEDWRALLAAGRHGKAKKVLQKAILQSRCDPDMKRLLRDEVIRAFRMVPLDVDALDAVERNLLLGNLIWP